MTGIAAEKKLFMKQLCKRSVMVPWPLTSAHALKTVLFVPKGTGVGH
jgi:hypothetical protein